jgi:UDP-glucose 4-epimerase
MTTSHVLITGGCGYIGSHTVVELLKSGCRVTILDNLSNSSPIVLDRIERIVRTRPHFVEGDVRDESALTDTFSSGTFDAVIHFAGLKAVGESVDEPLRYYDNNVTGSLTLFRAMAAASVRNLVFSSSATVYGNPHTVPIREDFPLQVTNPYGRSKLMVEEMLRDIALADKEWHIGLLRYFNPVGAHPSGEIGEDPRGTPNNLMPYIAQVAVGRRERLSVFGQDYPTHDGTGVRDYIHVVDLARGHLAALAALRGSAGVLTVNLGTGKGYSVLNMVKAFEHASGKVVPYVIAPRRAGDVAAIYADPSLAESLLGWKAEFGLDAMCRDSWNWQRRYPNGFEIETGCR